MDGYANAFGTPSPQTTSLTRHTAQKILGTVDRCDMIDEGRVLAEGTPDEVKQRPIGREEYLGDLRRHGQFIATIATSRQSGGPRVTDDFSAAILDSDIWLCRC